LLVPGFLQAAFIFLILDYQSFCLSIFLIHETARRLLTLEKWGLKPDQGMTMRRLRADGCLGSTKKSCAPAIVFP